MKTGIFRALRCTIRRKRRLALLFAFTVLVLLLAHPGALASDVMGNIGPAPQLPPGGWVGRYPVERYSLDQYFPAISVGFTSGVDASGVAPMIAYFAAEVLWLVTCFLANGVILLFALAFNLNLLTGNGTGGSGALTPVSVAIHNLYTNTFGAPWLIAMVVLVGCWAMWKALVQRRYTETAGALAVSLLYFVIAVGIVTQPERTIGPASKLSNEISTAVLSLTNEGSVGNEAQAKTGASNQLFELLVLNPWTVLEFGGIEHCAIVSHGKPRSVAVRPLSSNPAQDTKLAAQLDNGTEVEGEGRKTCINNRNKYAAHFLSYPFQSDSRNSEHEALENADDEDLPESDPGKTSGTYPLGPADEPAAEAMGKGGQYQRLLLAAVILAGEVGAYLLLGALALGVILAQILLLTLLAFAPVALLIGIFPGRGHDFFRAWISKLASYLARKVIYSLILAVVLAVCQALDDATSNLGWLLAFALQAAFLWAVFLQRNKLAADLMAATVGPRAANDGTGRLANLYYSTRLARMMALPQAPWRSTPPRPLTPSSIAQSGALSPGEPPPSGGAPSSEEPPPSTGTSGPRSHETPTHGPGAPTAGAGTQSPTGESPSPGEASPAPSAPPSSGGSPSPAEGPPPQPGSPHPPGEEPKASPEGAHTPRPRSGVPIPAQGSPETPATDTDRPARASRSTTTSTARAGSAPSTPPTGVPAPPPAPATEGSPAPGAPVTSPASPTPDEDPLPNGSPPPQVAAPPAPADPATHSRPPASPAIPVEEPAALLRARQGIAPTHPATKEDDFA